MITIKCPRCLTDNLYDAEFCRQCGLRLANDCPKCSASNPHQFTYCTQCGTSLERGQISPVLAAKEEAKLEEKEEEVPSEEAQKPAAEKTETQEPQITAPTELKEEVKHLESVIATIKEEAKEADKSIETKPILQKEEKPAETKPSPEEEALKIQTPARISTGIVDLDPLIGGGFLAGKVYLVSGESGTGKTIFGLQFLHQGLIEGENGIYISGDEKPGHLVVDAESLGWNFRKYVEQKKLGLFDISPFFYGERSGKTAEVDVLTVVNALQKHVKEIGAKRIVIDTIAPLVYGQENLPYIQAYTKNLVSAIEDNLDCTAVITSGILSGSLSLSRYGVEEFVAEGVIVLAIDSFGCHHARTLSIRKMRSTYSDLKDHIFDIVPQRGIVLKDY
jgi:circadian clock protein KaiC